MRGGDYGYHLADYLCIGQVYNTSEGKVMAEVQLPSLCAFGNDQKYLQSGPHELSTSSSPKKLQLLATENDNCNNEGQLCVEPQSAEKATNHSVGPSIPQLLEMPLQSMKANLFGPLWDAWVGRICHQLHKHLSHKHLKS